MKRLFCIGDSNTWGYDPRSFFGGRYPEEIRWTGILKRHGYDAVNLGANGARIPEERDYPYLLRTLSSFEPKDLCFLLLGSNNLLEGESADQAALKMKRLLQFLLSHHFSLLLGAPVVMKPGAWVEGDEMIRQSRCLAELYAGIARECGIPFADSRDWNVDLAFDGVHFSEKGHQVFARGLCSVLETL